MISARLFLGLLFLAGVPLAASSATAQPQDAAQPKSINERLTGDISPVHDPAIIRQGDTFYLFSTSQAREGKGLIHIRSSKNLVDWKGVGSVFSDIPAWAKQEIPGTGGLWAPDIAFVNGRFRLYYSVSTFGSNRSAIGLATNATLDPSSPEYEWRDEGIVFGSNKWDRYNAIDPNLVIDGEGRHWLPFGSFWTGIKMISIDPATGKRSSADQKVYSLAERARPGAIEAPFIIERGGYYYLFVSHDFCCRGTDSTYYTVVGRSKDITGPYVDRDGVGLLKGGGLVVLHSKLDESRRWRGPGHVAILREPDQDYIVYHAYDARNRGRPTLRIQPLGWTPDGWPVAL